MFKDKLIADLQRCIQMVGFLSDGSTEDNFAEQLRAVKNMSEADCERMVRTRHHSNSFTLANTNLAIPSINH